MNITSRSRYALKIMLELASHPASEAIQREDIAARQKISVKYLDQIMISLREGGLVTSIRGRFGGYKLSRAAETITVWQIFNIVEDSLFKLKCVTDSKEDCTLAETCIAHTPWTVIYRSIEESLSALNLAYLESLGPKILDSTNKSSTLEFICDLSRRESSHAQI